MRYVKRVWHKLCDTLCVKYIKMRRSFYIALFFAAVFSMSSCMKPNPGNIAGEDAVKSMNDLVVDNEFNWQTTQTISVDVMLPADVNLLPLSIKSADGKRIYFEGYPEDDGNRLQTRITIPAYEKKLTLSFASEAKMPDKTIDIQQGVIQYDATKNLKSMMMPCDLSGLITYSQGGWHATAQGNNAGTIRDTYFSTVYPTGLLLGDPNHFTIRFTSSQAVADFLPAGGQSQVLSQSYTDPASANQMGSWAGQIVAAMLNVDFEDHGYLGNGVNHLKDLVFLAGPFSGMSIANFLQVANTALGGGGLGGFSINEIAYAAEQINTNFENGDLNYFTCTLNSGGNGTGPTEVHYSGTLAYEDLWPWKGDYDFNDMVIGYDFAIYKNIQEEIRHITATFTLNAFGASFYNGFGFSFPNISPDAILNVSGYRLKTGSIIQLNANGLEANQSDATVIVFDDAFDLMQHPGIGTGVNTDPNAPYVTPDTLVVEMSFMDNGVPAPGGPVTFNQLNIGNFNPFIIVNQERGVEVHLPGYPPTDLANTSLIGSGQDSGDPSVGRYYKTQTNLPWAINIPEVFKYPIEKQDITGAYIHFADWAQSEGQLYPDWFQDEPGYRNASLIYQHSQ
jgi:LruC domain-containing protein